jgi:hemoglobin-like flavoprotein
MILRRLAHSIRRQDWVAVAIEFVIVVAGIFVGLQVTDWNEQRQLRERELNYLERLAEDLARMAEEFDEILERGGGRNAMAMRAFRALEQCDPSLATAEDFDVTLAGYQSQRTAAIISRTYDEMVSSGALAAMADQQLSGEIAGLFSALGNYKTFVTSVRASLPEVDRIVWQHVDLSYAPDGRPVLGEFDFDAACGNRELRNAAWEVQDLMWDWQAGTVRAAEQLDAIAERLDAHIAQPGEM